MKTVICESTDEGEIVEAYFEWLAALLLATADETDPWDFLAVTMSFDGGVFGRPMKARMPFWYPATKSEIGEPIVHVAETERFPAFDLEVPAVDPEYDNDDDDDELDDRMTRESLARCIKYVRRALDDPRLEPLLANIEQVTRFGIQWTQPHEVLYEPDFSPIIGPHLPAPSPPRTTLEVFSRLLVSLHGPDWSALKWSGDEVVGADLFGADACDATIELLDEIDDVAGVCSSLKTLHLRHTRITEVGLRKLAKLLPHVRVEVGD